MAAAARWPAQAVRARRARRQAAAAEAAALQQQLTSLETDYAAASCLLKTAQESLAEQQREKEALAQTVRDLQQSNARLSCQGQEAEKVLQQVRGELREAKEDAAAKGAAAEAGVAFVESRRRRIGISIS